MNMEENYMKKLLLLCAIGAISANLQSMEKQDAFELMRQQAQEELIERCEKADAARAEMIIDYILMKHEARSPGIIARTFRKEHQQQRHYNMKKLDSIIKALGQKARECRAETTPIMAIDEIRKEFKLATRLIRENGDLEKEKDRLMKKIKAEDHMFYKNLAKLNERFGK